MRRTKGPQKKPAAPAPPAPKMRIPTDVLLAARRKTAKREVKPFAIPKPPPGVVPEGAPTLAMDTAIGQVNGWAGGYYGAEAFTEDLEFLGYPYLAELAQRPEYRRMVEVIATEMTRKWIKFTTVGDDDKTDKIDAIESELDRLETRRIFKECAEKDGFFGRGHLYIDTGDTDNLDELAMPIGNGRDALSKKKIKKGSIEALKSIEATWTYPTTYNASNPLKSDWYNPSVWYTMGIRIHATRLLTFIGRPVPDLLKPSYSFGGLALTQMAKPYVDNWLTTRQSVQDLIASFTVFILKTQMAEQMQAGGEVLDQRATVFNAYRNNRGLMLLDRDLEEFENVSASLGGLDMLQAQSQEHMCVPAGTLIETNRGTVPIEEITVHDRVLTRRGLEPIKWIGITKYVDTLIEIESGDSVLRITEDHPIWIESIHEFVSAKNVSLSHRLLVIETGNLGNTANPSSGAVDGGGRQKAAITAMKRAAAFFMMLCGKCTKGLSRQAMRFITQTALELSTLGKILNLLLAPRTWSEMGALAEVSSKSTSNNVRFAAEYSEQLGFARNIVRMHAGNEPIKRLIGFRSKRDHVNAVDAFSCQRKSEQRVSALARASSAFVSRVCAIKVPRQPVYDIEMDGQPEFFANGILVHNSAVSGIPLVKLLGITPSGLSASSDGEIRCFYDWIGAYQEALFRPNLTKVIDFVQLSLFGEVDQDITFEFEPLWAMSEKEQSEVRKTDAETRQIYTDIGALAPEEIRKTIAGEEDSGFNGIDVDDIPDLLDEESEGLEPEGGRVQTQTEGSQGQDTIDSLFKCIA